jgi:hypothetical protein
MIERVVPLIAARTACTVSPNRGSRNCSIWGRAHYCPPLAEQLAAVPLMANAVPFAGIEDLMLRLLHRRSTAGTHPDPLGHPQPPNLKRCIAGAWIVGPTLPRSCPPHTGVRSAYWKKRHGVVTMTTTGNIDSQLDALLSQIDHLDVPALDVVQARAAELRDRRREEQRERLEKEAQLIGCSIHDNGIGKKSKRKPRAPRAQE